MRVQVNGLTPELFLELYARYERAVADYASALFFDYFGELVKQKEDFPCD